MTVIAFDGRTVAADKQATSGYVKATTTKLMRHGDEVLAASGHVDGMVAMFAWYRSDQDPGNFPNKGIPEKDHTSLYIFKAGCPVRIYERMPIPFILEDPLIAGGCGKEVALGAMHAGANARRAVEIACQLMDGCGMGIDVMELPDGSRE